MSGGPDNKEYQSAKKGESWKFRLRSTIKRAMEKCGTKEAFIKYMNAAGYEVRWDDKHKNIKYVCTKEKKYKKTIIEAKDNTKSTCIAPKEPRCDNKS